MLETVAFFVGGRWHFLGTATSGSAELAKGRRLQKGDKMLLHDTVSATAAMAHS